MKINKSNALHWIYLVISSLNTILALFLRRFIHFRNNSVILYGHKLNGNLKALYDYSLNVQNGQQLIFLTMDPLYYRILKKQGINVLFSLNPCHMFSIARAHSLISDHGLHSLILLLKFSDLKMIDVWHGIPFKGFDHNDFFIQHQYDEIWITSEKIKHIYKEKFGFSERILKVTGYARTDLLVKGTDNKYQIKKTLSIDDVDKKVILFAPTWKQEHAKREIFPFGINEDDFLSSLNKLCTSQDAICILRKHLNSTSTRFENKYENIYYRSYEEYPSAEEVLLISDILICDWSSIAFDYLLLDRPTVFLDVPPPFRKGFSLDGSYRFGHIVQDIDEMFFALKNFLEFPEQYHAQYAKVHQEVRRKLYDETADGRASERCFHRLQQLWRAVDE